MVEYANQESTRSGAAKRTTVRLWLLLVLALTVPFASAQALGSEHEAAEDEGRDVDLELDTDDLRRGAADDLNAYDEVERQDIEANAEIEGISTEEAMERFAWHESFSTLLDDIRRAFPGEIAEARLDSDSYEGPVVRFDGAAPAEAVDVLEEFPQPVEIVDDAGFSEEEVFADVEAAHTAVYEDPRVAKASSNPDMDDGSVTVAVELIELDEHEEPADAERARADLEGIAERKTERADVLVMLVEELESELDSILGGGHLDLCTSGFTVAPAASGQNGVLTAGHCSLPITYEHGSAQYPLSQENHHQGPLGDFQWLTPDDGGVSVQAEFFAISGESRSTVGSGSPEVGQRLCQYGRSKNQTCDDVVQINTCSPGNRCGLTALETRQRSDGDSGGPVYDFRRAYGVHSGNTCVDGDCDHDGFTRMWTIEDAFNVVPLVD